MVDYRVYMCAQRRMEHGAHSVSTLWYVRHGHIKCKVNRPSPPTLCERCALNPFSLSKCHRQLLQPSRAVAECCPHSASCGPSAGFRVAGQARAAARAEFGFGTGIFRSELPASSSRRAWALHWAASGQLTKPLPPHVLLYSVGPDWDPDLGGQESPKLRNYRNCRMPQSGESQEIT